MAVLDGWRASENNNLFPATRTVSLSFFSFNYGLINVFAVKFIASPQVSANFNSFSFQATTLMSYLDD